jgi:hypothetical protein
MSAGVLWANGLSRPFREHALWTLWAVAPNWRFESPRGLETWWNDNRSWGVFFLLLIVFATVIFPRVSAAILVSVLAISAIATQNLFFLMLAGIAGASAYVIREVQTGFLADPRHGRASQSEAAALEPASRAGPPGAVAPHDSTWHRVEDTLIAIPTTALSTDTPTPGGRRSHFGDSIAVEVLNLTPPSVAAAPKLINGTTVFVDYDFRSEICQRSARSLRDELSNVRAVLKGSEFGARFAFWIEPSRDRRHIGVEIRDSRKPQKTIFCECAPADLVGVAYYGISAM